MEYLLTITNIMVPRTLTLWNGQIRKKTTINPKNDDDRHFQNAAAIVLNFDETKKKTHRKF